MDRSKIDYTLYLCTDRDIMTAKTVEEAVESALKGGCSAVQLREKNCCAREFLSLAKRLKIVTKSYNVPLIINDRADIALLAGADGVHLGQSDLPCKEVRKLAGADFLIGVSCATPQEAKQAQLDGADYLGVGAVFQTTTKTNTRPVTKETLTAIRKAVDIPFVIIGGVNEKNICEFKGIGINGAAVISAILGKEDIKKAAQVMRDAAEKIVGQ